jgi:hypothetical protein
MHCKVHEAVGWVARTSIEFRPESPSRWGVGRLMHSYAGSCAHHPHHRRTQRHTSTRTVLTPTSFPPREHSPPLTTLLTHPASLPQLTPHCKVRRWGGPHAQVFQCDQRVRLGGDLSGEIIASQVPALATATLTTAVLSATHLHAQCSHPPPSLDTNTLLPSPPCSPTQRDSLS